MHIAALTVLSILRRLNRENGIERSSYLLILSDMQILPYNYPTPLSLSHSDDVVTCIQITFPVKTGILDRDDISIKSGVLLHQDDHLW